MKKVILDLDIILDMISKNIPKSHIAKKFECNIKPLDAYLKKNNIQYTGNASGKGIQKKNNKYIPFDQFIKVGVVQTNKLRKKLLREGYKEHKCEKCNNVLWLGNPIPLEVHHKDGDKNNNELDNLELLCPNCHAQTDTYRGKNIKKHKQ